MARILVLEDDLVASRLLKRRLRLEGYEVDCFSEPLSAMDALDAHDYDLMILDITLHGSDIDGVEFASLVRKKHDVPFIFLTSQTGEEAGIRGLSEGALVYITKPISNKVLTLQVKNILSTKQKMKASNTLKYKNAVLDMDRNIVTINGRGIKMGRNPFLCLAYLIENKGRVVSKEELSEKIWGDNPVPVSKDVINSTINRLRKELGEAGDFIVTHRGQGYEVEY